MRDENLLTFRGAIGCSTHPAALSALQAEGALAARAEVAAGALGLCDRIALSF
jgi:hypothetical protein